MAPESMTIAGLISSGASRKSKILSHWKFIPIFKVNICVCEAPFQPQVHGGWLYIDRELHSEYAIAVKEWVLWVRKSPKYPSSIQTFVFNGDDRYEFDQINYPNENSSISPGMIIAIFRDVFFLIFCRDELRQLAVHEWSISYNIEVMSHASKYLKNDETGSEKDPRELWEYNGVGVIGN
jgi:hypothetical protein